MKITRSFSFSDNGYEVNKYSPESDISELSEKAIAYGKKIKAITCAPQNKAKSTPSNKVKK